MEGVLYSTIEMTDNKLVKNQKENLRKATKKSSKCRDMFKVFELPVAVSK